MFLPFSTELTVGFRVVGRTSRRELKERWGLRDGGDYNIIKLKVVKKLNQRVTKVMMKLIKGQEKNVSIGN